MHACVRTDRRAYKRARVHAYLFVRELVDEREVALVRGHREQWARPRPTHERRVAVASVHVRNLDTQVGREAGERSHRLFHWLLLFFGFRLFRQR